MVACATRDSLRSLCPPTSPSAWSYVGSRLKQLASIDMEAEVTHK